MTGLARLAWPSGWPRRSFSAQAGAWPLLAPALLLLTLIDVIPILWSIGISFTRFRADRPARPPVFRGLGNYVQLLTDPDTWEHARNTFVLMAGSVGVQVVVGGVLALLLWPPFAGRRLVLTLVLTPMLLSTVAVGTFFNLFYDPTFGLVSALLRPFVGTPFVPLGSPHSAMLCVIVADAWMWSPFVMLLVLAGLAGVSPQLWEAATVDRVGRWRTLRGVIWPAIRPVLLLAVLFRAIESFNQFDLVYTITNGGPGGATETLATDIYDTAFVLFETGRASALANFSGLVVLVLTHLYIAAARSRRPG